MARILPKGGRGLESEDDGSAAEAMNDKRSRSKSAEEKIADSSQLSSKSSLSSGKTSRSGSRQRQAMGDAQESLNSLLQSPADNGQPTILSSSGAVRNTRGRLASPTARSGSTSQVASPKPGRLIEATPPRTPRTTSWRSFPATSRCSRTKRYMTYPRPASAQDWR